MITIHFYLFSKYLLFLYLIVNNEFKYIVNDNLNLKSLINQRRPHDAYCLKSLERKLKPVSSRSNNELSIQPNKASHFVAYFTKK
jgi:hypothetical protein